MVLMALKEGLADPAKHQAALQRGINWCLGMQSKNGGFASFDKDNTKEWLNAIPFADLKALVDPPTEDITGRILEMMGTFGYGLDHPAAARALDFLQRTQHPDGAWWGRWGVNYIYGTWSVLAALATHRRRHEPALRPPGGGLAQGPPEPRRRLGRGLRVLPPTPELMGQGPSTASQTAWALLGLMAAGEVQSPEVKAGIDYLVRTQNRPGPLGRGALYRHRLPQPLHDSLPPLPGLFPPDGPGHVCANAQDRGGRQTRGLIRKLPVKPPPSPVLSGRDFALRVERVH